ncbi:hypothetical protein [Promicromonospora sukumoe]|uniref:hypothetical protein n=1 Tax=Promicromonospora sukumoe TaxID=88382 RepID=UPI0012FC7B89|nr:hypothetical protein [Promicromonospora sukumoe]
MTSEDVLTRPGIRTLLPGWTARIAFGAFLLAVVVRLTGDVEPWGDGGVTAPVVAQLLLLPLLALTLWAASRPGAAGGATGTAAAGRRPRPVALTLVALALGYLGDAVVTRTLLPGVWDVLLGGMELEGVIYAPMLVIALLALSLVVQTFAIRGWLGSGRLFRLTTAACWVVGGAAVVVLISGVAHLDVGEYVVGAVTACAAWCVAVAFLTVAAWRVDRLAGIGALLVVAAAAFLPVGLFVGEAGIYVFALRLTPVVYVAGQALLAAGVLRGLHRTPHPAV